MGKKQVEIDQRSNWRSYWILLFHQKKPAAAKAKIFQNRETAKFIIREI